MKILVVGGGKMGLSHLAIANQVAGAGNVAVCDANRVTRFLYSRLGIKAFKSIDDAKAGLGSQIKGVIISTPTPSHFSIAQSFLDSNVPCFIEKPLTLSSAKSSALIEIAQKRNVYAQVGFVLRYVATFSRLHELVRDGSLGKVRSYTARMNGNVITKPDNGSWRTNFSAGGGCLNEYGPHLIDLCRFIFGNVASVESADKGHVHSTLADDRIEFKWLHDSGVEGDVKLDWCDTTKRKSVIWFDVNFEFARVAGDNSALHYSFHENCPLSQGARSALLATHVPPRVSFYLRGEEYSLQLEDFIGNCLKRDCRADHEFGLHNAARLEDGMAVDNLIETISKKVGLR